MVHCSGKRCRSQGRTYHKVLRAKMWHSGRELDRPSPDHLQRVPGVPQIKTGICISSCVACWHGEGKGGARGSGRPWVQRATTTNCRLPTQPTTDRTAFLGPWQSLRALRHQQPRTHAKTTHCTIGTEGETSRTPGSRAVPPSRGFLGQRNEPPVRAFSHVFFFRGEKKIKLGRLFAWAQT